MLLQTVVGISRDFIALFYPSYCLACSGSLVKGEGIICTNCMLELPQTSYHKEPDNPLKLRLACRIPVEHVLAFFKFSKKGRIQHLLHALKYKNQPEIGVVLGKVYAQKLLDSNYRLAIDLIIPVPLHRLRERRRGYNQSAKFAQGLSEVLKIPVSEMHLIRKHMTETQTRKSKLRRWENVSDVFSVADSSSLQGKHILLADDVITTGATIEACAAVLVENGVRRISVICIAVA